VFLNDFVQPVDAAQVAVGDLDSPSVPDGRNTRRLSSQPTPGAPRDRGAGRAPGQRLR